MWLACDGKIMEFTPSAVVIPATFEYSFRSCRLRWSSSSIGPQYESVASNVSQYTAGPAIRMGRAPIFTFWFAFRVNLKRENSSEQAIEPIPRPLYSLKLTESAAWSCPGRSALCALSWWHRARPKPNSNRAVQSTPSSEKGKNREMRS